MAGRSGGRVTPCAVCTMHEETRSAGFLVEPQNQGWRFSGLCLKTDSPGLMIWTSKSPRWFLGSGLKTKWMTLYRLCHKTDGRRTAWDARWDLAACFGMKQVWLVFPSLDSRLVEAWLWVVHVASSQRSRGVEVEDGWIDTMGYVGPFYPKITIFYVLGPSSSLVF
jgi:hypothetical protein